MHASRLVSATASLVLVLVACGDSGPTAGDQTTSARTSPAETSSAGTSPTASGTDLASVCPDPIVIQTGWLPQPERAFMYELVEPTGEHDASAGVYRGPAVADPSVTVEIRSGGPAVGFQSGTSLLYSDPSILLFDGDFDAMIADSGEFPVVGVMAPLEKNPQMLMFDPGTYDFQSIEDIKASGALVLVEPNATFAKVLVGLGKLDDGQIDDSYDFSPSRFVGEQGALVQQGFATSEPFLYENTITQWAKPVSYILNHDAGYPTYAVAVATRPETVQEEADCLQVLVPLLQQGLVDYIQDPGPINELLVRLSAEENSPSPLTAEQAQYAVDTMTADGIVATGPTPTSADFDLDRVQGVIDVVIPVLEAQNVNTFKEGLTAEDIVTNEFVDPDITL
jgi:hypothetical protein